MNFGGLYIEARSRMSHTLSRMHPTILMNHTPNLGNALVIITHFLGQIQTRERLWPSFEVHDRPVVAWGKVVGEGGNHAESRVDEVTDSDVPSTQTTTSSSHSFHTSTAWQLFVPYV